MDLDMIIKNYCSKNSFRSMFITDSISDPRLKKAREELVSGLADGSIKTKSFATYQDYLKWIYPNYHD